MKRLFLCIIMAFGLLAGPLAGLSDAKSYGGGGSSSSSGGSRSSGGSSGTYRPSPSPSPAPKASPSPAPAYRPSPAAGPSASPAASPSAPRAPPTAAPAPKTNYDSGAAAAARQESSRQKYVASTTPKTTYVAPGGQTRTFTKTDTTVSTSFRSSGYSPAQYQTRNVRITNYYGPRYASYSTRPVVIYNDPIHPIFYFWLLDQSINDRAMWVYNHRDQVDDARYREMCARDAALDARVRQLEAERKVRDPSYTPGGMDRDMMYNDQYVQSVAGIDTVPASQSHGVTFWGFCKFLFVLILLIGFIWVVVALVISRNN